MFKELAPLLRPRAVLLTISHISEDQFRVNVVPRKFSDGENDALTTPVSVSGTVEDLDAQLPQTLVDFVSSHLELKNTLDRAKADMDAAAKAAQTEARNKSKNQTAKKDANYAAVPKAAAPDASAPKTLEPPKTPGLFDVAPERSTSDSAGGRSIASGPASGNQLAEEDEENLAEINANREDADGDFEQDAADGDFDEAA
jgi:PRTRC genetic system protein E